jgi:V/A-type H+-transporting ATPase subunit E
MPGLDKILSVIEENGKQQVNALISSAENEADKIRSDGKISADNAYNTRIHVCKEYCAREYSASCSGAEAEMKREILAFKSDCINQVINKALDELNNLPDEKYFSVILELVGKHLKSGNGTLYFGKKDLARMPDNFQQNVDALASGKNSSVIISAEAVDIKNGFILSYGNISENCTFDAIAESERDSLRDKAAEILFK